MKNHNFQLRMDGLEGVMKSHKLWILVITVFLSAILGPGRSRAECYPMPDHPNWVGAVALANQYALWDADLKLHAMGNTVLGYGYRRVMPYMVQAIDISDPSHPSLADSLPLYVDTGIQVQDRYFLGVADGDWWLIDVADPTHLAVVSEGEDSIRKMIASGNRVFLDRSQGNDDGVLDFSDPANPVELGVTNLFGEVCEKIVEVSPGLFYRQNIPTGERCLLLDASNPTEVVQLGVVDLGHWNILETIGEGQLAATNASGVAIFDISDPFHPELISRIIMDRFVAACSRTGNYLALKYRPYDNSQYSIWDISDPNKPRQAYYPSHGGINDLTTANNHLCVVDGAGMLGIMDLSRPRYQPDPVEWILEGGRLRGLGFSEDFTYVDTGDRLEVMGPEPWENPEVLGWLEIQYVGDLDVGPTMAAARSGQDEIQLLDLQDPSHPQIAASIPGENLKAILREPHLIVDDHGEHQFEVYDVSDPYAPILLSVIPGPPPNPLDLRGRFLLEGPLLISQNYRDLMIHDVSDPTAPQEVYRGGSYQNYSALASRDGILVVAKPMMQGGIKVLDIHNPQQPELLSSLTTPGSVMDMQFYGKHLYLVDFQGGGHVIDLSDPQEPTLLGAYPASGHFSLRIHRGKVLFPRYSGEVHVEPLVCQPMLEDQDPSTHEPPAGFLATRSRVHPNPFNPSTTVHFELPGRERTQVSVYDVQGRRLAHLADEVLPAGPHQITWQGRDEHGRLAPSGVYFFRVNTETDQAVIKAVLLK